MKHWYIIFILWAALAVGCDPCSDCGEPLQYDPMISVIFINQDSATVLNDSIAHRRLSMEQIDSIRRILNLTLDSLEDSLAVIDALIEAGEVAYEDEQTVIRNYIADIQPELVQVNEQRGLLDSLNRYYAEILKIIHSGNVRVDRATLLNNGASLEYSDSAMIYNLPLLMHEGATETNYEFEIEDEIIGLNINYTLFETVSEDRTYRIVAANIRLASTDSIEVDCLDPENCLSNETTVTVYF